MPLSKTHPFRILDYGHFCFSPHVLKRDGSINLISYRFA